MKRLDCLKVILDTFENSPIIFTTGYTCREAYSIHDQKNNFYMVGSMGLASSIAFGLACSFKSTVVVVDGDGSLLMNPAGMYLAKILPIYHLLHIVLDNKAHDSTGGQNTHSENFKFSKMALLSGYKNAAEIHQLSQFELFLKCFRDNKESPSFLHAHIISEASTQSPRIPISLPEISARFKSFIKNCYHSQPNFDNFCEEAACRT